MNSTEPQILTKEQIEYLVSALPPIRAADENNRFLITEGIKTTLRELLREQKMVPEMIEKLRDILVFRHFDSFNTPGTSIGIDGSSGIGALIMQLTLNTFHLSGSASTASGLDALRDLIMARSSRTGGDTCTIVFSNPHTTFEEALSSRQYLVGSTVKDFVRSYEIDQWKRMPLYWWHDKEFLETENKGTSFDFNKYVMRLHLDLVAMRKHKVTIKDLEKTLSFHVANDLGATGKGSLPVAHIVAGPMADAIIDIYVGEIVLEKIDPENYERRKIQEISFLEKDFYGSLGELQVKGVKGLLEVYPQIVEVFKYIRKVKPLEKIPASKVKFINEDAKAFFSLLLDSKLNIRTGISVDNLHHLFTQVGCQFLRNRGNPIVVLPLEAKEGDSYPDPLSFVRQKVAAAEAEYEKEIQSEQLRQAKRIFELEEYAKDLPEGREKEQWVRKISLASRTLAVVPRPALVQAMEYVYLLSHNAIVPSPKTHLILKRLLTFPFIDPRFTYSNNMHTMAEVLGIEAAFNMVTQELQNVITSSGVYVHPSVIIMVAEFIMSRGIPYGATFSGISRHPGGHLANATLERAGSVFSKAAALGAAESIDNVSSSIVVASRIKIGTGLCDVGFEYTENGVTKKAINEEIYKINTIDSKSAFLISEERKNDLEDLKALLKDNNVDFDFDNTEDENANTFISTLPTNQTMDKKQKIVMQRFTRPTATKISFDLEMSPTDSFNDTLDMISNGKVRTGIVPEAFSSLEVETTLEPEIVNLVEKEKTPKVSSSSSRSRKATPEVSSSSSSSSQSKAKPSSSSRRTRISLPVEEEEDELTKLSKMVKLEDTRGL